MVLAKTIVAKSDFKLDLNFTMPGFTGSFGWSTILATWMFDFTKATKNTIEN